MYVLGIEGVHPKGTPDILLNVKQGRKGLKGTQASVTKKSFRSLKPVESGLGGRLLRIRANASRVAVSKINVAPSWKNIKMHD